MIRIIQTQLASRLSELFGRQTLERRLRRDRHEDRERDGAVREVEGAGAGFCRL